MKFGMGEKPDPFLENKQAINLLFDRIMQLAVPLSPLSPLRPQDGVVESGEPECRGCLVM